LLAVTLPHTAVVAGRGDSMVLFRRYDCRQQVAKCSLTPIHGANRRTGAVVCPGTANCQFANLILTVCVSNDPPATCGPGDLGRGGEGPGRSPTAKPQARLSQEPESKPESDRARVPESESKEESDLLWTRESESKDESSWLWTQESESTEESDFLNPRVRVQGRVRFRATFNSGASPLSPAPVGSAPSCMHLGSPPCPPFLPCLATHRPPPRPSSQGGTQSPIFLDPDS
jgi:hypothetical protein